MSSTFETMGHVLKALEYRADERKRRQVPFECVVSVEIYPGLELDGYVCCQIDPECVIEEHELTARDRDGENCDIDWDDLQPIAKDKIESQIVRAFNEWRLCA